VPRPRSATEAEAVRERGLRREKRILTSLLVEEISHSGAQVGAKPPSLKSNVTWTLWSNIVSAGCQWGMVVVIAKLGNAAMVGQYAYALAIVAPLILFTNLQLRAIQATDVRGEFEFGDYLGLRLLTTTLAGLLIVLLAASGLHAIDTALVILGLMLSRSMESISDVFYGFLQQKERLDYIARSTMIRSPLSLAVLAAAVYVTHSVFIGTLGLVSIALIVLFAYDIPVSARLANALRAVQVVNVPRSFRPMWRRSQMKQLTWTAIPLGGVMCLISLQTNIPRYFIESSLGEAQVGIFAALAYVVAAGNIITEALGQSVTPRLAQMYHLQNRSGFRKLLLRMLALAAAAGAFVVAVGWTVGPQLLSFLYKPEYVRRFDVFLVLLASAGPTYIASFLGYGLTAARLFWIQLPLSILSTGSIAVACLVLVPATGLRGAAEAVLLVSVLRVIAMAVIITRATGRSRSVTV
jgi:O-antigen/teichoic acid export membrane protein